MMEAKNSKGFAYLVLSTREITKAEAKCLVRKSDWKMRMWVDDSLMVPMYDRKSEGTFLEQVKTHLDRK